MIDFTSEPQSFPPVSAPRITRLYLRNFGNGLCDGDAPKLLVDIKADLAQPSVVALRQRTNSEQREQFSRAAADDGYTHRE